MPFIVSWIDGEGKQSELFDTASSALDRVLELSAPGTGPIEIVSDEGLPIFLMDLTELASKEEPLGGEVS